MDNYIENNRISFNDVKSYIIGFFLSLILTLIPFWMVIHNNDISRNIILGVIIACAVFQILIHLICFLHLDTKSEDGWNMIAIVFSGIIILIVITGSLWIMWNLNNNMMVH